MFVVLLASIYCASLTLNTKVDLSAANGKGGVYLSWSGIDSSDYYYKVEQKDYSGVWKQISTHKQGTRVNVLNVYPSRCSKPNWFDSTSSSYYSCQASTYNGYSFQTYNVTFTFDAEDNKINHELPKSASLKVWMEGGYIIENGQSKRFEPYGKENGEGDQIIHVTLMSLDQFHSYLNVNNWKTKLEKEYDVIVFGTWDASGSFLITDEDTEKVRQYLADGYGVLTGHDSLSKDFYSSSKGARSLLKLRKTFGIVSYPVDSYYNGGNPTYNMWTSNIVQITRKGLLTNFPWEIGDVGTELTIPTSHTTYHASFGTVWMQFNGYDMKPEKTTGLYHNFYLSTYNNAAMIQTGHSNCDSTADERKLLANTIYYLNQRTTDQFVLDHSSQDLKGPQISDIKQDNVKHSITFTCKDFGSRYSFRVNAIRKDNSNEVITSNVKTEKVLTGVKSIKYIVSKSDTISAVNELTETSQSSTSIAFKESDFIKYRQNKYYIYIVGVDIAGNYGEIKKYRFISLPTASASRSTYSASRSTISASRSTYSASRSTYSASRSTISASRSTYSASRSTYSASRSTLSASHSSQSASQTSYSASRSTISASRSTISASRSTISASRSTISASRSTYSASRSTISASQSYTATYNFDNQGQSENNAKDKSNNLVMYGAIGGGVAAAVAVGAAIFLFKRAGSSVSAIEKGVEAFNNDIPNDTAVDYENPLYDQNNVNDLDDPFDDDFN